MSVLSITPSTQIYIVAPAQSATGGPEALHQLAYKLLSLGFNAQMYYLPESTNNPVHHNYKEYNIPIAKSVIDDLQNVLIVPEVYPNYMHNYVAIQKVLWWLSVDNYFFHVKSISNFCKLRSVVVKTVGILTDRFTFLKRFRVLDSRWLQEEYVHLAQSMYAKTFLHEMGVVHVRLLSDFLHGNFQKVAGVDLSMKENIVVFNPKKGKAFTQRLIKYVKNVTFVPIVNMSREEVIALLARAKVYIDFGNHPGKDRIPREAALLGCCIITNRRGSAAFWEDVPIQDAFKIESSVANLGKIEQRILDCFNDFERNYREFQSYRKHILVQEQIFEAEIKSIFSTFQNVVKELEI